MIDSALLLGGPSPFGSGNIDSTAAPCLEYSAYLSRLGRADERTRTADLVSLRVITQALQGCAGDCRCRISRGVSFPCLAACCTVLRSRWYQNGIRSPEIARFRFYCEPDVRQECD